MVSGSKVNGQRSFEGEIFGPMYSKLSEYYKRIKKNAINLLNKRDSMSFEVLSLLLQIR